MLAFASPFVVLALSSCINPLLETPDPPVETRETRIVVPQSPRNKVDILFLVDNSNSMEAMAQELRSRFSQFFTVFRDLEQSGTYADLHIGVVTSDYGAGQGSAACDDYGGGQQGLLQSVGRDAPASCRPPGGNVNYIQYQFGPNGQNNLPPSTKACTQDSDCPGSTCDTTRQTCNGTIACAQDSDCPTGHICSGQVCYQSLVSTFTCMASVGTSGCGFEHVLESAVQALRKPENGDFLRSDALLTVVFLTNEDDCSAPADSDLFQTSDVLDAPNRYGWRSSYRCTQFGLTCEGGQLPPYAKSDGLLTCTPGGVSSGGKLNNIQQYIDAFTKPKSQGGIKERPADDVILVGIDAIPTINPADNLVSQPSNGLNQIQVILSDPQTTVGQPYTECSTITTDPFANPPCVPVLQHSCQNANPNYRGFFGDPPIRLNTVINSVPIHTVFSICENDYTPALQGLGRLIANQIGVGCITARLENPTQPDCKVEDVTQIDANQSQVRAIRQCDAGETQLPCWKLESKSACVGISPDGLGLTVVRGNTPVPPNTTARISCVTVR
jgi:hypothetical protein